MSKSVLVIDTPKNCMECLMLTETHECLMQDKEANYNAYSYTKLQEGCPLKKMPERMLIAPDMLNSFVYGWNACIDEIMGDGYEKTILTNIKDELQKMKQSTDVTYTQTYIPWNKDRGFSVECARCDEDDNVYDEDGELVHSMSGEPVEFEVYYQEDGKDIDCCTLDAFLGNAEMKSLEEFVKMRR